MESPTSFVPFLVSEHDAIRINNKHIEYLYIIFIFKINFKFRLFIHLNQ
jgi:hypothetical protein